MTQNWYVMTCKYGQKNKELSSLISRNNFEIIFVTENWIFSNKSKRLEIFYEFLQIGQGQIKLRRITLRLLLMAVILKNADKKNRGRKIKHRILGEIGGGGGRPIFNLSKKNYITVNSYIYCKELGLKIIFHAENVTNVDCYIDQFF